MFELLCWAPGDVVQAFVKARLRCSEAGMSESEPAGEADKF